MIELNDLSKSGFLQNDGSLIQISVPAQSETETRFNWVHNSVKQGIRFDNSNIPNSPYGQNGRCHHNVSWETDRIFFKGDKHFIYNNLVFDSHQNDLIVSSAKKINGLNYETITKNNIANKISGSRSKPAKDFPIPGYADFNWDGTKLGKDVRTQLRDPDNFDFRPKKNSDLIDAGEVVKGMNHKYLGKSPDIGPYEYGDKNYWIPGYQTEKASRPVPPNNAENVKADADLMWLFAYKSNESEIYFGEEENHIQNADRLSKEFKGKYKNNIYSPNKLEEGKTYYWRVDAVKNENITKGNVWKFTVGD